MEAALLLRERTAVAEPLLQEPALQSNPKNGNLTLHNYASVTGDEVKEIVEPYLRMREPFEKNRPDIFSDMKIEQIDDEEFYKLFGKRDI
jgi:hypothetical protein